LLGQTWYRQVQEFISSYLCWYSIKQQYDSSRHPMKGDTTQYIYTNSQHNGPLRRVVPIECESF